MNRHPLVTPHRALYGALVDMQRSAWRRAIAPQQPRPRVRSTTSRWHRAAVIVGWMVGVVMPLAGATAFVFAGERVFSPQSPSALDERYAEAVQALRTQRYAVAYGMFAELADVGHAPSALPALAMARHGPTLYGSAWSATAGQLRRWRAIALRDLDRAAAEITEPESVDGRPQDRPTPPAHKAVDANG